MRLIDNPLPTSPLSGGGALPPPTLRLSRRGALHSPTLPLSRVGTWLSHCLVLSGTSAWPLHRLISLGRKALPRCLPLIEKMQDWPQSPPPAREDLGSESWPGFHRYGSVPSPDKGRAREGYLTNSTPTNNATAFSELHKAAESDKLYTHHFNMLRGILEKTAAFLVSTIFRPAYTALRTKCYSPTR